MREREREVGNFDAILSNKSLNLKLYANHQDLFNPDIFSGESSYRESETKKVDWEKSSGKFLKSKLIKLYS